MPKQQTALVPPASELANLSEGQLRPLMDAITKVNTLEHWYAVFGMFCGTLCLLGSLGTFAYLVHDGHPKSAAVVLGTTVLGIIRQMISRR